ncbi:hypothetical protein [Actinospongicola halichondriae]|uniref:hypothetical protein n=1 Tax=Actinospongicola halichondriae TaxID=3236844 RepID=UPI003D38F0B2
MLRRLLIATLVLVAACAFDEAEIFEAGAPQIDAEVGQLRVLTYDDDPARDDWVDVVAPDPAVFEEGAAFREADSRTAADDQPAEERRLFTGLADGRTLLVQLDTVDGQIQVWDLVVGDADQPFSDGTAVARAGEDFVTDRGSHVVVVRSGDDGEADTIEASGLELVASHTPDDGADLHVDVYRADVAGEFTISYEIGPDVVTYSVTVR